MTIDLNPMLRGEISSLDIDFKLAPDVIDGVVFTDDAHVYGCVTDNAGYMKLSLSAALPYEGECARCLEKVCGTFSLDLERTVVPEGMISEDKLEEDVDEYIVLKNGFLCPDDTVREELLLDFPKKLLCSQDCLGLCSICGKPKKDGDCGCVKKEPDPRLAVLKKLLDKE